MRVALLVVLLALGAAVAAIVVLVRPARESAASASPPASVEAVRAQAPTAHELVLPSEPARAEESAPGTTELPSEPVVETLVEPQPVDFEAKYAGRNLVELKAAHSVAEERLIQLKVEFLEQKFATGDFDLTITPSGTAIKPEPKYPDGSPRLEMWKVDHNPDGTRNVKWAHMRPEEDPGVFEAWREETWLKERVYELQQSTKPKKP
ncbi:MAG TPA: hypothetical protein VNB06_18915 [Thermoanaerobaculia bacterium]|nr:hypothetical protein [Thermoanaerobaculia bacterium]